MKPTVPVLIHDGSLPGEIRLIIVAKKEVVSSTCFVEEDDLDFNLKVGKEATPVVAGLAVLEESC